MLVVYNSTHIPPSKVGQVAALQTCIQVMSVLNLGQNIVLTEIFHTFGQSGALPQIRL
jgi:hypothetical protein